MSQVGFNAVKTGVVTGTAAKTLLQLVAAANHRVVVKEIAISFAGISATDPPVLIEVLRQTTAGTMTAGPTLVKANNGDDETVQTTAQHTATVEPTAGDVLMAFRVHPQGGLIWQAPPGGEIVVPGGTRLGIRATTSTTQTADLALKGEE